MLPFSFLTVALVRGVKRRRAPYDDWSPALTNSRPDLAHLKVRTLSSLVLILNHATCLAKVMHTFLFLFNSGGIIVLFSVDLNAQRNFMTS